MGKPEMGPIIVLKISGENLSEEELKKLQIDSFRESYVKPNGRHHSDMLLVTVWVI